MTLTPEELEAHLRKSHMLADQPIEQARTSINGPLYGLTEEVFGLQYYAHIWQHEDCMRLEYLSPRYEQYRYRYDQTFVVTTRLFGEDEKLPDPPGDLHPPPVLQAGALVIPVRLPGEDTFSSRLPGRDRSHRLVAKDATFTIDGSLFKGSVIHYTASVRYSSFMLYHGRIELTGEALGPSLEELIQIVESLRDLNSKAGEWQENRAMSEVPQRSPRLSSWEEKERSSGKAEES
jgi:hypothetical protein